MIDSACLTGKTDEKGASNMWKRRAFLQFAGATLVIGCGSDSSQTGASGGFASNPSAPDISARFSESEEYLGIGPRGVLSLLRSDRGFQVRLVDGPTLLLDPGPISNGQMVSPKAALLDDAGNLYVSDPGRSRVAMFSGNGNLASLLAGPGDGDNQVRGPAGLALDRLNGRILVADQVRHRVLIFGTSGNYLSAFGSLGSNPGQLNGPTSLAIDRQGNIYVGESGNCRISVFDSSGTFLRTLGSYGSGPNQFLSVADLALTGGGQLLAADPLGLSLKIFDFTLQSFTAIPVRRQSRQFHPLRVVVPPDGIPYLTVAPGPPAA